jgi:hypothetical protein
MYAQTCSNYLNTRGDVNDVFWFNSPAERRITHQTAQPNRNDVTNSVRLVGFDLLFGLGS